MSVKLPHRLSASGCTDEKVGMERMRKRELPGGIGSREVSTPRSRTHLLESGPQEGVPVLFVHGNVASSLFFEETLAALPPYYLGLAPDLRWLSGSVTARWIRSRG